MRCCKCLKDFNPQRYGQLLCRRCIDRMNAGIAIPVSPASSVQAARPADYDFAAIAPTVPFIARRVREGL